MKRKHLFFPILFAMLAVVVGVSSGLGIWLFGGNEGTKQTINYRPDQDTGDNTVKTDDLAENYFFAANIDEDEYYDVYFFPQSYTAYYSNRNYTGSNRSYSTPVEYYDNYYSSYVAPSYGDKDGYWGTRTTSYSSYSGSDYGNKVADKIGNDGTEYGYIKFENVYKQLSTTQYATLGTIYRDSKDSSKGWNDYFAGFTSDESVAQYCSNRDNSRIATGNIFSLAESLSKYKFKNKVNGKNVVYLYAVFTNGDDRSNTTYRNLPSAHLVLKGDGHYGSPYDYQWMFLPNNTSNISTRFNNHINQYFTMYNVLVKDTTSTGNRLQNVFYKDYWNENEFEYKFEIKNLNSDHLQDNFYPISLDTSFIDSLEDGCFYNFYIYFDQVSSNTNPTKLAAFETAMTNKNIVYSYESSVLYAGSQTTGYCEYGKAKYWFCVERIYDYRITGQLTNTFDYNGQTGFPINLSNTGSTITEDGKTYQIYETSTVAFTSISYLTFAINYGSDYDDSILIKDNHATNNDITSNLVKDDSGNSITNPAGGIVFFGTENYDSYPYQGNYNGFSLVNYADRKDAKEGQKVPVVSLNQSGTYRIRAKIYYSNGKPTEIKVAVAYTDGLFIEICDTDPNTNLTQAHLTSFIDHSNYKYKAFFSTVANGSPTLSVTDKVFSSKDGTTAGLTIGEVLDTYGSSYGQFYDHVSGQMIRYSKSNNKFTKDNGSTWTDTFVIDKNYVFYPHAA